MIETLGVEQVSGGRQVLLALPNATAPGEGAQQDLMRSLVERGELEPFFQVTENVLAAGACDQMFQDRRVGCAQAAALGRQPALERRAAVDLQRLQKVADEQRRERPQPRG